ncbi:hypothetical protein [Herbihabitans rhizosphaerae]|uniref:hypothetical protein n=1 Tax=Herbihabitans rhizosphaerae TaxID=1872711 RepID=UPI001A92FF56|nr:hypothetical protein [Herbihabitans rhizosphaerae]
MTLGWQVLRWTYRNMRLPDGDNAGDPWVFTSEQARFVLWFYAVDETGRFVYRNACYRRMKGSGKDPLGAAIAAVELCGPARFSHFDSQGDPVGKPHSAPWIQVAAVSQFQTRNTMQLFASLFAPECVTEHGIDLGKEIIHSTRGGRIEAVATSPRAMEGNRPTFVLQNETHHWISTNGGHDMNDVIRRNLAKARGGSARALSITNAHNPGEDSVAEREWDTYQKMVAGKTRSSGFLYDSLEAPPGTDMSDPNSLRAGLLAARGDSTWLDVDGLMNEIWLPQTLPSQARRFYLNQIVAAEDALVTAQEWDLNQDETLLLLDGEEITLGFDGGKTDDATALVAVRVEDRAVFPLLIAEKPTGPEGEGWEVDREMVNGYVHSAFARYTVVGFFADLALWETYVDSWAADYGQRLKVKAAGRHAVALDMRGNLQRLTVGTERVVTGVRDGDLIHNGNTDLRRHVLNARRRPNQYGVSFGKEHRESSRKVDAFAALQLADMARAELLGKGRVERKTGIVVYS